MKLIKPIILLLLSFATGTFICSSQAVVVASGGNLTGTGGNVSYTVGQSVYSEAPGSNGAVMLGIQHSFERTIINSIAKNDGITLDIVAFPNPVQNYVMLRVEDFFPDDLSLKMYDSKGILLIDRKIKTEETEIAMSAYAPGTFFINIFRSNVPVKTFKIIKN